MCGVFIAHVYSKAGVSSLESYHEMEMASSGHLCNKERQFRMKLVLNVSTNMIK